MANSIKRSPSATLYRFSAALLSLMLLSAPAALAHGGHGDEFQGGDAASHPTDGIQVDAETAKRIGLKVEPVSRQRLAFGVKTTGQIEAVPSRQVEVTYPVGGRVVRLFVQPGDTVKQGQALAVITSGELAERRIDALDRQAEANGEVKTAETNLKLAQQAYTRQQQIAQTQIQQAQTDLKVAQEQYDRDQELTEQGAIPKRQFLESESRLAGARKGLAEAESRLAVLEAGAEVQRAQTTVEVARSRAQLSTATYGTRLNQLGADANADGTITISAPIAGKIADREASLGQASEDAGTPLMTIVNDGKVLATANIYEKDLNQISVGQPVRLSVASLPDRTFQGRITVVGAVVDGESRVVPVKAELDNFNGALKPGMSAELEVVTDRTPNAVLAIPRSALTEVNGKQVVYVQNGTVYQQVELTLGREAGDWIEVKSGLFEGDQIVTQRAAQLYAQSLRGGGEAEAKEAETQETAAETNAASTGAIPWWLILPVSGVIAGGAFWAGRRTQRNWVPALAHAETNGYGHANHNGHGSNINPAVLPRGEAEQEADPNSTHHPY